MTSAEKLLIKVLKEYVEDICFHCVNEIECLDEKCDGYVEGVGDDQDLYPNLKWTCLDFNYGSCSILKNTPCDGCFDNDYSGFKWDGKEEL